MSLGRAGQALYYPGDPIGQRPEGQLVSSPHDVAPVVLSVSPNQGVEAGGQTVTITGQNFASGSTVTVNGSPATGVVFVSPTELTCVTPAGSGLANVVVTNPGGKTSGSSGSNAYNYGFVADVDFTALALGVMTAAAFKTATPAGPSGGLDYARGADSTPGSSTVQVSASSLVSSVAANQACLGSDGTANRGLVVQPITGNLLGTAGDASPRNLTVAWSAGTAATAGNAATGVDGVASKASTVSAASGKFAPFANLSNGSPTTFSSWQHAQVSTPPQQIWNNGAAVNTGKAVQGDATTTFQRLSIYNNNGDTVNFKTIDTCDCRDYSGVGGTSPQARAVVVDAIQIERGNYTTEAILAGLTTRQGDRLSYSQVSDYIRGGRLRVYLAFYPKFSSSDDVFDNGAISSAWYLFSFGSGAVGHTSDARIDGTHGNPRKVTVVANDAVQTSTGALAFTASGGLVEIVLEFGNNQASTCKYRQGGSGTYTDLGLPTFAAAVSETGLIGFLHNAIGSPTARSQFPVWLAHLTVYSATGVTP